MAPRLSSLFRSVAQAGVEPVISELMPYFERDEARHVGLGVLYLPKLLAKLGQRGAGGQPGGGPPHLVVLHHTDCGIKRLADYPEMLAEFFEIPVTDLDTKAVSDPYAAVRIDVDILRRALPAGLLVSGLVYDTDTGLIEVVVPPSTSETLAITQGR